ncbi:hypothetical protein GC170_08300 [bacterium]|nr:hypothetical protein [bacterium]
MRAIGRIELRRKHLYWAALAPFVLWVLAVETMPTRWLARRLEASLERITGLPARVDSLRLTLAGGVVLNGVHVGPVPEAVGNSTKVDVRKVVINAQWMSIFCGRLAMTEVDLIGVEGTLAPTPEGSWLPKRWLKASDDFSTASVSKADRAWLVDVEIRGGEIEILDPEHSTRIRVTNLMGVAEAGEDFFRMSQLTGRVDGGHLVLAMSADRAQEIPIFDGHMALKDVPLGSQFDVLGMVCPLLAGPDAMPRGRMNLEVYLQGRLESNWQDSLKGRGALKLDPLAVEGLPLVRRLGLDALVAEVGGNEHKLEDLTFRITNPFTIQQRRVVSPALIVDVGPVPLKFEGWTDFDGRLDYAIRTDAIRDQLPRGVRGLIDDLKPQDEALAIRGRLDELTILVNDQPVTTERFRIRKTDLRNEVEQISRRLSERFSR